MKKLAIIGASGHGKVVADIAKRSGYTEIIFFDDDESVVECGGYPVIGRSTDVANMDADVIVAIGNAEIRERIQESIEEIRMTTLIHPDAVVAEGVLIGVGSVLMAGIVINPGAKIGRGCIINTCSSVDHDCIVGDYTHVSVGAHIAGTCEIGEKTWIGAGATVSNNISICPGCKVGVGAAVINNIQERGTYVGIPARKIKK